MYFVYFIPKTLSLPHKSTYLILSLHRRIGWLTENASGVKSDDAYIFVHTVWK